MEYVFEVLGKQGWERCDSLNDYFAGWERPPNASDDDDESTQVSARPVTACVSCQTPKEWAVFSQALERKETEPRRAPPLERALSIEVKAPEPKRAAVSWSPAGEAHANTHEILFYALLLLHDAAATKTVGELTQWATLVRRESFAAEELKEQWKPANGALFDRMANVTKLVWHEPELSAIGTAMRAATWHEGHHDNLDFKRLRYHLDKSPKEIFAVRTNKKKKEGPPRWRTWAITRVADTIYKHSATLRRLLALDVEMVDVPTSTEVIAEQKQKIAQLEKTVVEKTAAAAKLQDAWRKAAGRLKTKNHAVTEARRDEHAKATAKKREEVKEAKQAAKCKIEEHEATVREEVEAEYAERLSTARARSRKVEKAASLYKPTLKRLHDTQQELKEVKADLEEMFEEEDAMGGSGVLSAAVALEMVQSMPTWQPRRASGRGGGRMFDMTYRRVIYSQHENGTPKSAIGPNVVSIVKATAPWLEPVPPSKAMLSDSRFELRTAVEACAAREVASAHRIRVLGSDETTKFGNAGITSNVLIEPTPGANLKIVVLRGAYCSSGGTAAAIAAAIETKCFARGRDFIVRWEATCRRLYPNHRWTGPDPKQLSLSRLAGGGAFQGDTCNTAQLTKQILTEMAAQEKRSEMGAEAWDALTEAEQQHAVRCHKLDCHNHMRNIFLGPMSKVMSKHVANELKYHLDAFSSWERMTSDFDQLLRACYKEFHHGNRYYKGKGREFWVWLQENHPHAFVMHLERAEGGRQDLDFDAAVPMYIIRRYMVDFLHLHVFGANHSNVLEDFLYITLSAIEYVAMLRANAVVDLLISRPLRWLAGKAFKLANFSPLSLGTIGKKGALDLAEEAMAKAAMDGASLLNPELDIFKEIAQQQPLFKEWCEYTFNEQQCLSADGRTKHRMWQLARDEILSPADPTNAHPLVKQKTIEYLEVQMIAGLEAMRDKKRAISKYLSSQDGAQAFNKNAQAHADCAGLDATNDRLCEGVFGIYDSVLRRFPGISMEAASALTQAMHAKRFAPDGYVNSLPPEEQHALIEMSRLSVKEMRALDRKDHTELDAYHTLRRKTNAEIELESLVKQYALALSFYDRWLTTGVESPAAMVAALAAISSNQLKLDYLREQIEMRVVGLGFDEFKTSWSSSINEEIGTIDDLTAHLKEILMEECERRQEGTLPTAAVVPTMRRKSFKELGTATPQAEELAGQFRELPLDELLERAEKERQRLESIGELDHTVDVMPKEAPPCDESLIGKELEVRWRYWRPAMEGERGKRKAVNIWCVGEVVQIANGTTDKESPRCKNPLSKGAVCIKWPADADFDECEHYTWSLLTKQNWNRETVLGWRYSKAQLEKLGATHEPAGKRRK